ncbi:MAG: zinc ribbon domain-containing protein [Clostridiales bacterium]|nr:zinc ribbon domain-containing protein [Clostridiales bacterium]
MFCRYCGKEVDEKATFCQHCGSQIGEPEVSTAEQTQQVENQQVALSQEQNQKIVYPMKWWKFLVYFLLFASAIFNVIGGIEQLTGSIYEEKPGDGMIELVYSAFPALKPIDVILGLLTIALGVFAIFVRQSLYKFKAIGPKLLLLLYAFSCLINVIYCISVFAIVPEIAKEMITDFVSTIVVSVIMIIVNNNYFNTRKELFIN